MTASFPKTKDARALAFGRRLRVVMNERDVSTRELGRRLSVRSGRITPLAARRTVMKYLAGDVLPSAERRGELAAVLGVESERMSLDEDDEEADLVMALQQILSTTVRRLVRVELERRGHLSPEIADDASGYGSSGFGVTPAGSWSRRS